MPTIAGVRHIRTLAISDLRKAVFFGMSGGLGGFAGAAVAEPFEAATAAASDWGDLTLRVATWFAAIGAGIALGVAMGLGRYLRGRFAIDRRVVITAGLGALAGFASGYIAQSLYAEGGAPGVHPAEWFRVLCWGVAGGLLGLALGQVLPNLGWRRGGAGGAAGGLLGGVVFVILAFSMSGTAGRLAGCAAIGFLVGLMIVLAEAALREAWLEVVFAENERRIVSLGSEPVSVGSGRDCTVFLHGAPDRALVFRLEGSGVTVEDAVSGGKEAMASGDMRQVGRAALFVRTAGGATGLAGQMGPSPGVVPRPVPAASGTSTGGGVLSLQMARGATLPLTPGRRLVGSDIPGLEPGAGSPGSAVAEVASHPSRPGVVGLKNLSHRTWDVRMTDGTRQRVEPGRAVTLAAGLSLDFGQAHGEVS